MLMTAVDPEPLACPGCGSDQIVLAYTAPVYVVCQRGVATRVVVGDEEVEYGSKAWCRHCGERFTPPKRELGTWPAWQVGW